MTEPVHVCGSDLTPCAGTGCCCDPAAELDPASIPIVDGKVLVRDVLDLLEATGAQEDQSLTVTSTALTFESHGE